MIIAKYEFEPYKNELPEHCLKLLVNIKHLNNVIYDEVFAVLTPLQQEQYVVYRVSDEAKKYREERNAEFLMSILAVCPNFLTKNYWKNCWSMTKNRKSEEQ